MGIKKQIAVALSACMLLTTGVTASAVATNSYASNVFQQIGDGNTNVVTNGDGNTVVFIDVPNNYWAQEQITQFAQAGIINGYSDGSFRPQANVTREEFCKLLVMTFKQSATNLPSSPTFSDVLETRWSYGYVEACREFLTGYANPFGGRPAFHPAENATREDIAVALVRMMGYKESDASDADYALYHFNDGSSISPQLRAYVSIAYEKGLITGYPDGTFRPEKGVTRAEVIVMLNRATKQAVTDINADLDITASLDYSADKKTAIVHITAEQGATVTVNGESVSMSSTYSGECEGSYTYQFAEEGRKDFVVTGSRAGKTKTITLTGSYAVHLPELQIESCPTSVSENTLTVSGTIFSQDSMVTLTLNGQQVQTASANSRQSWSKTLSLKEGENTLTFVLTDSEGHKVTQTKTVTCALEGPVLKITDCPTTSTTKRVTIKGTMHDANSGTTLTLNGKYVDMTYAGNTNHPWQTTYELQEGANTLNFELTNDNGKTAKETRTIQFNAEGPVLKITDCPETSNTKTVTIRGAMHDVNSDITLTLNGKYVDFASAGATDKAWRTTYELQDGENTLNFELSNANGKVTKETRTIQFSASAPSIRFIFCPETTQRQDITLRFNVEGETDNLHVYVNDKELYAYGSSYTCSVTLNPGDNVFNIRAVNGYGKDVIETKTIYYDAGQSDSTNNNTNADNNTDNDTPDNNDNANNNNNNNNDNNNNNSETVSTEDFTAQVLQLVNKERAKEGLSALDTSSELQQAAQVRAKEQVQKFSHTRPNGSDCFTALDEASVSYMTAGENIAAGQRTPESVMDSWMNSPGHRSNILSPNFTKIGIGYINEDGTPYWVQMFIG